MHSGVLNMIIRLVSDEVYEIFNHPAVKAVSFTGSNGVGIRLYEQASRRGAKVQCEMGGKNPVVILEDADMDLAVESAAQGAFGSSGQRCTDRKSTRLNSSHLVISYAVFCLKKKNYEY